VLLPWLDASLEVTAGQYFLADRGFSVDVARFFGDTQVSLFYTRTVTQVAGIQVSLPLTPRRDMRPGWVQVRGARRWRYEQSTVVNMNRNVITPGVAILPETPHNLEEVYQNSDRTSAAHVRRHLRRVRDAYLQYGQGP
jgi:hypothetical protein